VDQPPFRIDRLTAEQRRILETAERGHNILITGQGGPGKSYLINRIVKSFRTKVKMLPSWNAREFLSGGFSRQVVNRV